MYVVQKDIKNIFDYREESETVETVAVCDTLNAAIIFLKSFFNVEQYTKIITYKTNEMVGEIMMEANFSEEIVHRLWIQEVYRYPK